MKTSLRPLVLLFSLLLLCSLAHAQDNPDALDKQVNELYRAGKYQEAIPIAEKVVQLLEKLNGPDHPTTATGLNHLAVLYYRMSEYAKAEPAYQRALAIYEKALGPNHPDTATTLNNLAGLYDSMGDYAKAELLYRRTLAIREKALGPDHPDTAGSLLNLAVRYKSMGDYAKAEPLFQRALMIFEKTLGPEHPDIATSLNNLAALYDSLGDYAKAEPLYQRALAIREKNLGPNHPDTATSLHNLAVLYRGMGDYAKAKPLYQRALMIFEKVLGPEHPNTATSLNNLAVLYRIRGDYAKAEPLYQRALAIREKTLGPEHPRTASSFANLAGLYKNMGDYAKAELFYQRALAIFEKALGPDHPDCAQNLNGLAVLYYSLGDYAKAEPFNQRALLIFEIALGPEHPDTATSLNNRAELCVALGKLNEALVLAGKAWRNIEKQRGQIAMFASERQQSAFTETLQGTIDANLTLAAEQAPADPAGRRLALAVVLSSKGAILEAVAGRLAGVRQRADPAVQQLSRDWQAAGRALLQTVMTPPKPGQLAAHQARIAELEQRKEAAEEALARASAPFASERRSSRVAPADVARALPPGSALVEFAKYRSCNFKAKGKEPQWGNWNYVALVVRGGQAGAEPEVGLVRLGPAVQIETAIQKWRRLASVDPQATHGRGQSVREAQTDDRLRTSAAKELAALVWEPLVAALGDCRKVYLSPDGELAFVAFGALPGREPGKFLIEDYDIGYVATGRDLLRPGGGTASPPLLVGAPDFGEQQPAAVKSTKDAKPETELRLTSRAGISDLRSFATLSFPPLPGTLDEVQMLAGLLKQRNENPTLLTGAQATEEAVKSAKHPRILHLATHGFFLPDSGLEEAMAGDNQRGMGVRPTGETDPGAGVKLWQQLKLKNPMHRSGIALAGANDTILGRREPGGNDGILTAEEVAGMDLWGTQLVVISACESGLGEARGGEGVFGLRRAFTMAGAQSLIMSLWSVNDVATCRLMQRMHACMAGERTPQRALLRAQRDAITDMRKAGLNPHPFYWSAFVASGIGLGLEKN